MEARAGSSPQTLPARVKPRANWQFINISKPAESRDPSFRKRVRTNAARTQPRTRKRTPRKPSIKSTVNPKANKTTLTQPTPDKVNHLRLGTCDKALSSKDTPAGHNLNREKEIEGADLLQGAEFSGQQWILDGYSNCTYNYLDENARCDYGLKPLMPLQANSNLRTQLEAKTIPPFSVPPPQHAGLGQEGYPYWALAPSQFPPMYEQDASGILRPDFGSSILGWSQY